MLDRLSVGTKIIILIIIGLVIIAGIVLGFLYLRQEPEPEPPAPVVDETQPPPREPITTEPQKPLIQLPEMTEQEKSAEELQNLARVFAERYGSFSNQGGFQNIDDVKTLVTEDMKDWLEQKKQESMEKYPINDAYFGVTTSAPISKVESFTEDKAMIIVTTQRRETKNGETTNYNQDIKIEFTKQDGKWLISGAYWQ